MKGHVLLELKKRSENSVSFWKSTTAEQPVLVKTSSGASAVKRLFEVVPGDVVLKTVDTPTCWRN